MDAVDLNNLPLVSIIITNHNYGLFLRDAVSSALEQTYGRKEIIVVDDGSTDDSREIISSYGRRIIPLLKENGGQGSAFNHGFSASRGEIILFLDADDVLLPGAAELVVKKWGDGIAKVQYRLQVIDGQGKPMDTFMPSKKYVMPNGDMVPFILTRGTYMSPPCSGNAYRRQVLEKVLPLPDEQWRMSADVYVQISSAFYGGVLSIEDTLGYYRIHGKNKWYTKTLDLRKIKWGLATDYRRRTLILSLASRFTLKASFEADTLNSYGCVKKLALAVFGPRNVPLERGIIKTVLQGVSVAWGETDMSILKRALVTAFLILSPLFPRNMARVLFLWYLYPENRPSFLQRIL